MPDSPTLTMDPADADLARRLQTILDDLELIHLDDHTAVTVAARLNGAWDSDPMVLENLNR